MQKIPGYESSVTTEATASGKCKLKLVKTDSKIYSSSKYQNVDPIEDIIEFQLFHSLRYTVWVYPENFSVSSKRTSLGGWNLI